MSDVIATWPAEIRPMGLAACGSVVWRFRGRLHVTAVVKATFSFNPGGVMMLEDPDPVNVDAVHHDDGKGLWAASDLAPYRSKVDVVLVGHAHVRGARGQVRLAVVGDGPGLDKTLVCRAREPVALGPVTSGAGGALDRQRILELPSDLDWSGFQTAPPDQRMDALRGDEWLVLEGLHPTFASFRTRLPWAKAAGRAYGLAGSNGAPVPLAFHADNLHIDADRERCSVAWRATFPLPGEEALSRLSLVAGVEFATYTITWPEAAAVSAPEAPLDEDSELGLATLAFEPPEEEPAAPVGGRQSTVLLDWGASGPPAPHGRQATVVFDWGEAGPPQPATAEPEAAALATERLTWGAAGPPPLVDAPAGGRQSTVVFDWGEAGPPQPATVEPEAGGRQATVALTWGEAGPPPLMSAPAGGRQSTVVLEVPPVTIAWTEEQADNPLLMGTMVLSDEQAATPLPMASPFPIATARAPAPAARADIPGAPWARGALQPDAGEDIELLPDSMVELAPPSLVMPLPAAAAGPIAAPVVAEPPRDAEPRAWSWATVAEPEPAPPVERAPAERAARPVPKPALKGNLYGKFSPGKKR